MRASQANFHPGYDLKYPICSSCYFKSSGPAIEKGNVKRIMRSPSKKDSNFLIRGIGSPCMACGKLTGTKCSSFFYINSRKQENLLSYEANLIEILEIN